MKAINYLIRQDDTLAKLINRVGPYLAQPAEFKNAFEALSRSITYQQLSGKAAGTIYQRLVDTFGDGERPDPSQILKADLEQLRSVGLSKPKSGYISDLAQAQIDGQLPNYTQLQSYDDQTVIDCLTVHRGVGVWTVQMLLMSWLKREDVLPLADLGIQKGFQVAYKDDALATIDELVLCSEKWRPYRSVACWYLWRANEL